MTSAVAVSSRITMQSRLDQAARRKDQAQLEHKLAETDAERARHSRDSAVAERDHAERTLKLIQEENQPEIDRLDAQIKQMVDRREWSLEKSKSVRKPKRSRMGWFTDLQKGLYQPQTEDLSAVHEELTAEIKAAETALRAATAQLERADSILTATRQALAEAEERCADAEAAYAEARLAYDEATTEA